MQLKLDYLMAATNRNAEVPIRGKRRDFQSPLRLYGMKEAAAYLDVHRKHLESLRRYNRIIAPIQELSCGPIWSQSQLDEQLYMWKIRDRARERKATSP